MRDLGRDPNADNETNDNPSFAMIDKQSLDTHDNALTQSQKYNGVTVLFSNSGVPAVDNHRLRKSTT